MMKRQPKALTPEKALIRLEELCARAEHCTYELAQKLRTWGIGQEDSEVIIHSLQRRRFVDDSRFAASFVRDRYGRVKIRLLLRAKRIDSDTIDEALAEIDDDEYLEILKGVVRSKMRGLDMSVYEDRAKVYRHALSRGYEAALVSQVIKGLL